MDYSDLIYVILSGLAASYIVRALLLRRTRTHMGPFKSERRFVVFYDATGVPDHFQPVTLFDWIRRAFGVYSVKKNDNDWLWAVNDSIAEYFTCPFCFSWWVSLPFTVLYVADGNRIILSLVVHFSISATSYITYRLADVNEEEPS